MFERFSLLGRAIAVFKPTPAAVAKTEEVSWSESSLYRGADFPKYNPDSLIGRKGYTVYSRMMTDEQVKAVVRFKRDAITSRAPYFQCEHEDLSDEENDFRVALFEHVLDQLTGSFSDSLNGIMSAMYNGFSMTEKIQKIIEFQKKSWVGLDRLELKPCDTFYFHVNEYGQVHKLVQKYESLEQELNLEDFIHFVQNPDYDKHYGRSELREAYRAWFSKDMAIKFQNIHMERFAAGFAWAKPVAGKTLTVGSLEYTTLQKVMQNLSATSSIIFPGDIDFNLEHPATTDLFERKIAQEDKAIAKALLVPNLLGITEQGGVGSYSQSETQMEAFFWTLEADTARLEDTLNEQVFSELGDLNWADGLYPRLKFKPISERRKMEIIKTWTSLVTGKAVEATDTDEKHLRDLLEFPEKGDPIAEPVVPPTVPGQPPVDQKPNDQKPADQAPNDQKPQEETIVGKMKIGIAAMSQATKRVDFSVLASKAEIVENDTTYIVAAINSGVVARLVGLAEELKLGTADGLPADLQKIQFTASEMSAMKKAISDGLKESWKIGESHARREISKAKGGSTFAVNDLALQDVAAAYLKQRAYTLAGDISSATQKTIRNILMEGVKVSKTFKETKLAIYRALEKDGMLTQEAVAEALGVSTVKNAAARIMTAIRTVSFEAINEARYSFFSDPGLDGFVEALEYSSVLDDRTTEICSKLNGETYGIDAEEWATFRPPNHFNCRSILIPVTIRDTWTASDPPNTSPQKGFGFSKCNHEGEIE